MEDRSPQSKEMKIEENVDVTMIPGSNLNDEELALKSEIEALMRFSQ